MNPIPSDTTLDVHRKQIEILRKMSPEKRALISFELSDNVRNNIIAGIRKMYPDFTDTQIKRELLQRCYGEGLFQEVAAAKGWKQ